MWEEVKKYLKKYMKKYAQMLKELRGWILEVLNDEDFRKKTRSIIYYLSNRRCCSFYISNFFVIIYCSIKYNQWCMLNDYIIFAESQKKLQYEWSYQNEMSFLFYDFDNMNSIVYKYGIFFHRSNMNTKCHR